MKVFLSVLSDSSANEECRSTLCIILNYECSQYRKKKVTHVVCISMVTVLVTVATTPVITISMVSASVACLMTPATCISMVTVSGTVAMTPVTVSGTVAMTPVMYLHCYCQVLLS